MGEPARGIPDTSDMAAVHRVFRSSLASGSDFVGSAAGDDARRALIANYYDNVVAFLHAHHEGEDELVYPLLLERVPDRRDVLELGLRQHVDVLPLMDAVATGIDGWRAEGDSQAQAMLGALQALDDALTPHLDYEEDEVVPLAAEHLTMQEWGALPGHALRTFTGDKVWLIMGLIRENFTPDQRDAMLENMPPPAREMWETVGETSFDDLIAQVRQAT
jgi:Hemerythrin HHE cation binding domain